MNDLPVCISKHQSNEDFPTCSFKLMAFFPRNVTLLKARSSFQDQKRALKIIHLKSLRGFYALCLKPRAKCKLLIVFISPMYHTSLLTMYCLKNTVLKTARNALVCEFTGNQLSPKVR